MTTQQKQPEIKPNTCPYCGGPYMLFVGCVNACEESRALAHFLTLAAEIDPGEQEEPLT